jgi:hypothetical protein
MYFTIQDLHTYIKYANLKLNEMNKLSFLLFIIKKIQN